MRATELAQRSGQHKQIVGVIVDELERLGYVRREPDPADRRAKLIVPTETGLDEIDKARAILTEIERRHRQKLGDDAYQDLQGHPRTHHALPARLAAVATSPAKPVRSSLREVFDRPFGGEALFGGATFQAVIELRAQGAPGTR